ncbi:MAG: hypothetical protein IKU86_01880 [Thermoguttaceae bacterium]|nr:hypothetical protein [Thermoguttaceae bacterium]
MTEEKRKVDTYFTRINDTLREHVYLATLVFTIFGQMSQVGGAIFTKHTYFFNIASFILGLLAIFFLFAGFGRDLWEIVSEMINAKKYKKICSEMPEFLAYILETVTFRGSVICFQQLGGNEPDEKQIFNLSIFAARNKLTPNLALPESQSDWTYSCCWQELQPALLLFCKAKVIEPEDLSAKTLVHKLKNEEQVELPKCGEWDASAKKARYMFNLTTFGENFAKYYRRYSAK